MNTGFYSHFHAEEKAFVDRAQEWIERSAELHELRRTDFLDPRQQFIMSTLCNRNGSVTIKLDGGYTEAERKRAIIAPDYRDLEYEDAELAVLQVTSPSDKFHELDHGDFLGALLGLGIKRDKVGDIHLHETFCHIVVAQELSSYFDLNLRQVHRLSVLTDIIAVDQLQPAVQQLEELSFTVASMRLDGIASDAYRISRAKIVDPIKAGRCRLNWKTEEDPSAQLKEGDVVSIKGLGRFKLLQVDGVTKKGRTRVKIGKYL
ncbi:RNA-binding protein [Paenibacillus septentrionalis]|uniref:RNA-binding protein n=1 Tax=Paenibacillus septentrionalis TaxID=429342 RepID=A0ABW1UY19_9BACL